MSYSPSIPAANDIISQSQAQIQTNFSQLQTKFSVDHISLTDNTNGGYHAKVTFNNIQSDPTLSFPQTELYTKTSTNGTVADRFNDLYYYEKNTSGTSSVIQLTGGGITAAAWCLVSVTIPGGALAVTSSYNVASVAYSGTTFNVTFSRPFTNGNYIVSPTLNLANVPNSSNAMGYRISSKNATGCSIQCVNQVGGIISPTTFTASADALYVIFFGTLA